MTVTKTGRKRGHEHDFVLDGAVTPEGMRTPRVRVYCSCGEVRLFKMAEFARKYGLRLLAA